MYGLLFLIIGGFYFSVVAGLLFWVKPLWSKGLVLIVAIFIPNADDWYYRYELAQYCKNEAGFKVYEQVSKREGFVDKKAIFGASYLKTVPSAYVEWAKSMPDGKGGWTITYWRSDRLADASITKPREITKYSAPYEMVEFEKKQDSFIESFAQIFRRADGKVLAEFKSLYYYGGWYPGAFLGRGGLVAGCGEGGQVIPHDEWTKNGSPAYRGLEGEKLLQRTFVREDAKSLNTAGIR